MDRPGPTEDGPGRSDDGSRAQAWLARMEQALDNADAELTTRLGVHHEQASARVWHGQVLVDWQADDAAGGCLLRPALVRRLLALHARVEGEGRPWVDVRAHGSMVTALSQRHAQLAARLGRTPELRLRLRFDGPGGAYTGGDETYRAGPGERGEVFLHLTARVRPRSAPPGSERTSPAPS